MSIQRYLPILIAIVAQLITLALLLAVIQGLWHGFSISPPLWTKVAFQMLGAGVLSHLFGLPRWWVIIQLILPVAVIVALDMQAPTWVYPVAFFALLFFFWNSANERVPLYLSNATTWCALGDILDQEKSPINFIDLGCGLAGTLTALARRFPQHSFTGVETAPFPYLASLIRCRLSGCPNIKIKRQSLWDVALSDYQIVYAFLSPAPMPRLFSKASLEMQEGTKFISNSFTVPESPATKTVNLDDNRKTKLLIWEN